MGIAVQDRPEMTVKDNESGWITRSVHGNSKRQCMIKRDGNPCGSRASMVTAAADGRHQRRLTRLGVGPIYHCEHPRHIANAHKQITEALGKD